MLVNFVRLDFATKRHGWQEVTAGGSTSTGDQRSIIGSCEESSSISGSEQHSFKDHSGPYHCLPVCFPKGHAFFPFYLFGGTT